MLDGLSDKTATPITRHANGAPSDETIALIYTLTRRFEYLYLALSGKKLGLIF
jgi:hypothetical protein